MEIEPDTRKFGRVHFDRRVNIEFSSEYYDHCQAKNLSLAGMFVKGDFQQQVGRDCLFRLDQMGLPTDFSLQAAAKVVRQDDEGIGLQFTAMPFESYMLLKITLLDKIEYPFVVEQILPDDCPFEVTQQW